MSTSSGEPLHETAEQIARVRTLAAGDAPAHVGSIRLRGIAERLARRAQPSASSQVPSTS